MRYVITDIDEETHTFQNAEAANQFIQKMYKDHADLCPTIDSITTNSIFIVYERIGGIYE